MRFIYYYDCIIIKSKKEYRRRRKRDLSFMLSGRKNKGSWRAKAKRLRFSRKGIPILNNAITTIKHIFDTFFGGGGDKIKKKFQSNYAFIFYQLYFIFSLGIKTSVVSCDIFFLTHVDWRVIMVVHVLVSRVHVHICYFAGRCRYEKIIWGHNVLHLLIWS